MIDTTSPREFAFELTGGTLCFDFANTVDNRPVPERRRDHLCSFESLVAWARQTGVVSSPEAGDLTRKAEERPARPKQFVKKALLLREAIYEVFSAVAAGRRPPQSELETLNLYVGQALAHVRLKPRGDKFVWTWDWREAEALERLLWPIAKSAADLLTSERLATVRECAAETCGWLFLDNSRNQSRRWCDMRVCGNREKVRRFYRRARGK